MCIGTIYSSIANCKEGDEAIVSSKLQEMVETAAANIPISTNCKWILSKFFCFTKKEKIGNLNLLSSFLLFPPGTAAMQSTIHSVQRKTLGGQGLTPLGWGGGRHGPPGLLHLQNFNIT